MPKKLTFEFVKEYIESFNYTLLSKKYKNSHTKLSIQCNMGHIYEVKYGSFKQGQRCHKCNIKKRTLTYDFIKEQIELVGHELISNQYINAHFNLLVKCDKGHIYPINWNNFNNGQRCNICSGNKRLSYGFIKDQIEMVSGYKLLSKEYKNAHGILQLQCDMGHEYEVSYNNFKKGQRCSVCANEKTSSESEIEIQFFVTQHTDDIVCNDRKTILNPNTGYYLELDVYLPKLKKAIEYNGTYWHSLSKSIEHDKIKKNECKRLGIDLLIIDEKDYIIDKDRQLNKIKQFVIGG